MSDAMQWGLFSLMFIGAIVIASINDWQKRRLVERARQKGERPKAKYFNNRTDWRFVFVACIVVVIAVALGLLWKELPKEQRNTLVDIGLWVKFVWSIVLQIAIVILALVVLYVVARIIYALALVRLEKHRIRDLLQAERIALQGDLDQAIELVQRVLNEPGMQKGKSRHISALYRLAAFEGMRGNWDEANSIMQKLDPDATAPLIFGRTKSIIFWRLGRPVEAEEFFRQSLSANPTDSIRLVALGLFLFDTGRVDEATGILQSLNEMLAGKNAGEVEIDLVEHLHRVANAQKGIGPEVPQSRSDVVIRQLLISSMEGIFFRDPKRTSQVAPVEVEAVPKDANAGS